jgi:SAM-dependent methyltransferase
MSAEDREKWDQRYREGAYASRNYPSEFLRNRVEILNIGRAMDLACGLGRNSIYLAELGFEVDAIDVSLVGLEIAREKAKERRLLIHWLNEDLVNDWTIPTQQYDLILMFRFVSSEVLLKLPQLLAQGGALIIEEHLQWPQGNVVGPSGNRFRVKPGELMEGCKELDVLFHYEGLVDEPDGSMAALAQIHAKKSNE